MTELIMIIVAFFIGMAIGSIVVHMDRQSAEPENWEEDE